MRIVVLGAGGAHKTEASLRRAARALGHACRVVDAAGMVRRRGARGADTARRRTESFAPDFVLMTRHAMKLGESVVRDLLRGRDSAFWYFDLLPNDDVLALGRLAGRMYVTSPGRIAEYRAAGIARVAYLPQALDPETERPARWAPPWYRCDASFVGSGHYPHRHAVLRAVAGACRLQIRGPGWDDAPPDLPVRGGAVRGRRFARVVRGAKVSLGANALPAQDREPASASNRMWKVLGCGGFYLGQRVDGIERFARHGEHCVWYRDADEAVSLLREYLTDAAARTAIAAAGRAHALAEHTYALRLELLLGGGAYEL